MAEAVNDKVEETMTVRFTMKSGVHVTALHVVEVSLERSDLNGDYNSYSLRFAKGKAPKLFSLSIPEIAAVEAW